VTGVVYTPEGLRPGSVGWEGDTVADVIGQRRPDAEAKGLVLPAFVNAHTHVGDAFIREELRGTLEDLVAPPHGLKHRRLAAATDGEVLAGMAWALDTMAQSGVGTFWDFREGGVAGLRLLLQGARGGGPRPVPLGRPLHLRYDRDEVDALLAKAQGIGVSSLLDWEPSELAKVAKHVKDRGKVFALHCSEGVREDIDPVLDLRPDFLVHMVAATTADLERCRDADVPVVVCPRSNAFFGRLPDLPAMVRTGVRVFLGTDNGMLVRPSMLEEIEFAYRIARLHGGLAAKDVVDMALAPRKGLKADLSIGIRPGDPADLLVLDVPLGSGSFSGVLHAAETDVALVCLGGKTWQRKGQRRRV
jgi:cytosine/adenosine deaminase-related metal-dependent hydrolase